MKLPEPVVVSVRNLVSSVQPIDTDAYERLREQLTASYSKTRWQQAFALIKHPDLGDRRPSQLMNEMLALLPAGDTGDSTIFLALFLLRLPVSMRDHLGAADFKTAAEMAARADTLWDARAGESAVSSLSAPVDAIPAARRPPALPSGIAAAHQIAASRQAATGTADRLQGRATRTAHPLSATTTRITARKLTSVRPRAPGRETR